uniref:Uncharacterized protein n=1 Tax=Lepeophtheirus salmonis TaxID=72036 RepID=A0A0K2TGW0_LEPSM
MVYLDNYMILTTVIFFFLI